MAATARNRRANMDGGGVAAMSLLVCQLRAQLLKTSPEQRGDAAPTEAGAAPQGDGGVEAEASRSQTGLHPSRAQIAEAVHHGVDDILCFVSTALRNPETRTA